MLRTATWIAAAAILGLVAFRVLVHPAIEPATAPRRATAAAFDLRLPPGFPQPLVPSDNPMTAAKVALGRALFYDTRLSGNGTFACATCHQQAHAFTDARPRAIGSTGQSHARSAMSLTNVAYNASLGWADDTLRTLEAQMRVPMFNEHPIELGLAGREVEIVDRFARTGAEVARFRSAFPSDADPVTLPNIVKAIASFERTLISGNSPLDRYLYRDDRTAMNPAALRGMSLFFSDRLGCAECHAGFNLSGPSTFKDAQPVALAFHNTGLYNIRGAYPAIDRGLIDITKKRDDMGRFRAPTLRNVALTAPYMHDGSVATLEEVIVNYGAGGRVVASGPLAGDGRRNPFKSRRLRGFRLAGSDVADLVSFLDALTDTEFVGNPAFGPEAGAQATPTISKGPSSR